jgi:ABC-type molybdate transport system substrate-binding protein
LNSSRSFTRRGSTCSFTNRDSTPPRRQGRSRDRLAADQRQDYVGPLPAELQDYVDFAVGVLAVSNQPDAAQAMVKFVSSPEAAPLIRKSGMEPPPR